MLGCIITWPNAEQQIQYNYGSAGNECLSLCLWVRSLSCQKGSLAVPNACLLPAYMALRFACDYFPILSLSLAAAIPSYLTLVACTVLAPRPVPARIHFLAPSSGRHLKHRFSFLTPSPLQALTSKTNTNNSSTPNATGNSTPPVTPITKPVNCVAPLIKKEKRQSSSRFNITKNRELSTLRLLDGE